MGDEERVTADTAADGEQAGAPNSFEGFTPERWAQWINAFLNREDYSPAVEVGNEELHHVLARVYNKLAKKADRDRFAEGLAILFESTPLIRKNAAEIYYIIELLQYLKPIGAKRIIRRHLYAGTLKGVGYGRQDLHTMLLVAASKYDVDDELSEHVKLSARDEKHFGYQLVCLRVLSMRGQEEFLSFFKKVFNRVTNAGEAAQLAREIKSILRKRGYSAFCRWYTDLALNPSPDSERAFQLLEPNLREIVFDTLDVPDLKNKRTFAAISLPDADPYFTLIAAQLHAYDRWYTPRQVVAIAKLHEQADVDLVVNALIVIWRRTQHRAPNEQSWIFITPGSLYGGRLKDPHLAMVSGGSVPHASPTAEFNTEEEPDLALIFERVKTECEVEVPPVLRQYLYG